MEKPSWVTTEQIATLQSAIGAVQEVDPPENLSEWSTAVESYWAEILTKHK